MNTDLRTRQGRRAEILAHIRKYGGFSVFWVTENQKRAWEATRMVDRKEIDVRPRKFPWSDATIIYEH